MVPRFDYIVVLFGFSKTCGFVWRLGSSSHHSSVWLWFCLVVPYRYSSRTVHLWYVLHGRRLESLYVVGSHLLCVAYCGFEGVSAPLSLCWLINRAAISAPPYRTLPGAPSALSCLSLPYRPSNSLCVCLNDCMCIFVYVALAFWLHAMLDLFLTAHFVQLGY